MYVTSHHNWLILVSSGHLWAGILGYRPACAFGLGASLVCILWLAYQRWTTQVWRSLVQSNDDDRSSAPSGLCPTSRCGRKDSWNPPAHRFPPYISLPAPTPPLSANGYPCQCPSELPVDAGRCSGVTNPDLFLNSHSLHPEWALYSRRHSRANRLCSQAMGHQMYATKDCLNYDHLNYWTRELWL